MSADDFQTKYASVMDSMLKSAIAETTKLFETMVDELKAEISRIKKENEDLKTRCSRFENASSQPTFYTRESEPLPGRSDRCEKRDTAVQCDLVSFCTMLVEQDQPLSHSSLQSQKQQCSHEEMEYALQEHNYTYGGGNAEMAFILVKQEQEEVESTMVYRQVLSDKADSPWASACGTENQGPFINRVCSTREIPLSERHEETQVALELPSLGTCSGLQDAQNQSSEQEHSVVISLSAIKDDLEEESEVNQKISEGGSQGEFKTSEKHQLVVAQPHEPPEKEQQLVVPRQCQRESEMLVNEQTDITQQQNADAQSTQEQFAQTKSLNNRQACDELKNEVPEVGSHQPDLSVQCRRGQQPKKAKHLKPVKEILQSSSDIPAEQEVKKSPAIRVEEVEVSSTVDIVHITSSESPQTCPVQPKDPNIALEGVENTEVGSLVVSVASLSRGCSSEMEKTRKSRHLSMVMEEGTIQTPATEISSAIETPAESPQALSVQSKDDNTSVTLQDAMLLVEAMNQSMVENTFSSLQLMATPPQAQCVPHVGAVQTVDEVSAEPPLPVETHEAIGTLPITELSATTQSTIEELSGLLQATGTTPTNEAEADMKVVIQKQQQAVFLSKTTTSSVPPPAAAIQRSVQSFHRHHPYPLITLVAPSRRGNTVPHKIIVVPRSISSLMPHKLTAQSTNQLPAVVSIVDAAQNSSVLSTAAGLPLRAPSSFPVSQKTLYVTSSKSLPVVRPSTTTSVDLQSGSLPPQKTIRIPRQVSAVASRKHQLQTIVLTAQQESNKSSSPVMVSPPQFISSSQESSVSVGTQTASGKVLIKSSQNVDNTPDNFESPKQTASVSETINAHTETCSSLSMSVGLVPPSKSPAVPPTLEQQLSAVVRLTRLPFPISTKESVFVSRLPPNGSSDSQSILKKSCVVIPTQPPETLVLSTDIRSSLKEASLAVSANTSQMSEEPDDIQEKASLTAENCIPLEESPSNGYFQPSTPSKVSQPVFEKSAVAINMTEFSAVSGTAAEHTSNLDEEIGIVAQDGVLPNGPSIEEIQSPALIHLTSSASKDTSDPQLQMLKTQFLPQLAVSPVEQDAKKASWSDSIDARASCAEPSTSDNKGLRKKSLMAQLQSHIKMHFQARRSETNPEPHTETRTHTVSPKKSRSENDHPNNQNITSEPIPLSPKNPGVLEDVTSLKKTSNDPTPIIPRRSGLCVNVVEPQETVNESSVSLRTAVAKNESASVSPRRSSSTAESVTSKKIKQTCVRLRRTVSTRNGASPKNTNNGDSPNNIKTNSVTSKRTSSSRDGTSPKKTKYTSVSPGTSGLSKISTSSKISTNESTSVNHRKCTFTKDGSSTKQNKRESNSISPRKCSTTTDGARTKNTKSETYSQSVRWPKLAKDGASPRKAGKSASPRLIQDGTCPEINPRVVNDKLSKAADAKTIAKMKNAKQSELQNGAKTSQLAENSGSCKAVKKCTAKAVWTPPRMPTGKTLPAGEKMSVHFPVKKETVSQDRTVVYPPSVPLHPIPVKAPPVVSPLQPLSVIGRRLLKNQCGECGRVLSSSVALESHVSLHKGRRPFSCTLCGKRFADAKGLKRHGRVHRNGRIHMCQKCGKGFVYRFCLTKHLQMVHSRIKPFVCQMCDKGFFTKRDVEAHIRVHTGEKPFHCNLCEKKFARRVELNVHLRWHNGEKRHWCPYCGKGFLDFNNLKRHKYTHTGEKPHSCPYCPKNFTQSGHLKKHVKNVHKIQ